MKHTFFRMEEEGRISQDGGRIFQGGNNKNILSIITKFIRKFLVGCQTWSNKLERQS